MSWIWWFQSKNHFLIKRVTAKDYKWCNWRPASFWYCYSCPLQRSCVFLVTNSSNSDSEISYLSSCIKKSWCYMNIANLFSYRNTFYSHWTKISFYKYWIGNTIFLVHILWEIHNIKCAFFLRGVYVVFSSGTFHKIFTLSDWRKVWLWLEFFWGS